MLSIPAMEKSENALVLYTAKVEADRDEMRLALRVILFSKDVKEIHQIARAALTRI